MTSFTVDDDPIDYISSPNIYGIEEGPIFYKDTRKSVGWIECKLNLFDPSGMPVRGWLER